MSKGLSRMYGPNAALAASSGSNCQLGGCPSCIKSGLPVLVVRAGVLGKNHMQYAQGRLKPLLSAVGLPSLKYLNYGLRTLKEGYLYAYYEKAHTPEIASQDGWQLNLVDEGGYLTPVPLMPTPLFGVGEVPAFSCERTAGYAAAMLFVIPDAKNTQRVWVAYSESPWSPETLRNYAANESLRNKRMVCIDAPTASSNANFSLSKELIEELVYDYAPSVAAEAARANPHQRRDISESSTATKGGPVIPGFDRAKSRPERAVDLITAALGILGNQGQYEESNLMLVLANDVIGLTHEAAVLRTTMFDSASQYALRRANQDPAKADWMLKSAMALEGLFANFNNAAAEVRREYEEKGFFQFNNTSMMAAQFHGMKDQGLLPADAIFSAAKIYIKGEPYEDATKPGTVFIPAPEENAKRQCDAIRGKLRDATPRTGGSTQDDRAEFEEFLAEFAVCIENDSKAIMEMEGDYFTCLDCAPRKLVFDFDFDQSCAWSGFFYLRTTARICHGGHITGNAVSEGEVISAGDLRHGKGVEWYANYLSDDPKLKENILLRALLGNSSEGFDEWLDKRDKHYGLIGNVLDNIEEQAARNQSAAAWIKLSAKGLPALKLAASGYVSVLLPIIGGAAYALSFADKITPAVLARISTLVSVLSNASARGANVTLVSVTMPLYKALRIWRSAMINVQDASIDASRAIRGGKPSMVKISDLLKRVGATAAADALVDVYLWIDKAPREMEAWAQANAMKAIAERAAIPAARRSMEYAIRLMPGVASSTWTKAEQYISNSTLLRIAGQGSRVLASGTAVMAAGVGVLSVFSVMKNVEQFRAGDEAERNEAAIGMLTGALSFGGATLTLAEDIYRRRGGDLVAASLKLAAGRLLATATFIDAGGSAVKMYTHLRRRDTAAGVVLGIQAAVLAASGFATLVAATGSTAVILGLSMTGWGLVLILAGIGLTFIYQMVKNSPLEAWAARTFWGKAGDTYINLEREQRDLDLLQVGAEVEFNTRLITEDNLPGGKNYPTYLIPGRVAWEIGNDILSGEILSRGTFRNVYLRLRIPAELSARIQIHAGIFAKSRSEGKVVLLNSYSSGGSVSGLLEKEYPGHTDVRGSVRRDGELKSEGGVIDAWCTSAINLREYIGPHAVVWIQELGRDSKVLPNEAEIKILITE